MSTTSQLRSLHRPSENHWAVLAATRFVLSLIVFFGHLGSHVAHNEFTEWWDSWGELAAVIGFFAISGFSIANSIESKPERFYRRRIWRIWPTFLVAYLIFTVPVSLSCKHFMGTYGASWQQYLGGLFMLNGIIVPVVESNAALWTLAIEEWYYIFAKVFNKLHSGILLGMVLISSWFYFYSPDYGWHRFASEVCGTGHLCFLWAWLGGFLFYRYRHVELAVIPLIGLPVFLIGHNNQLGGIYSALTLSMTALMIAWGGKFNFKSTRLRKLLVMLGNVSFPLYIIHYPIFVYFENFVWGRLYIRASIVAVMICWLTFKWVDSPNRGRWIKGWPKIPLGRRSNRELFIIS